MNVADTALADQAQAANREGWRAMQAAGSMPGWAVENVAPGPAGRAMLARLSDAARAGLAQCGHLRHGQPLPQAWCAWEPTRLMCLPCARRSGANLSVMDAERCDHCGQVDGTLSATAYFLPGAVAPGTGLAIGPTQVLFGLCATCAALSGAAEAA